MTRKPRTALGGGLLVAVLLVSGCQGRLGAAATVGGSRITTDALDSAYRDAAGSAGGKAAGAALQTQVLTQLVQLQELREVVRREHVVVSQGLIDTNYAQVVASSASSPQTTATYQRAAEITATQTALGIALAARGGKVDNVQLYGVPVKDDATAHIVLNKLTADLGNAAALAQQYTTIKSVGDVGGQLGNLSVTNKSVPQVATAKINVPFIATIEGGTPTIAVFMVTARLDVADVAAAVAQYAKVTINPRFGTWGTVTDASTGTTALGVTARTSDVVIPNPAASAAPASAAPGASVAPGASQAPAATAPAAASAAPASASAAPATAAAPAPTTAAPAPSATPSASAAVTPSAAPSS